MSAEPGSFERLLDLPVRHRGITLGRVVDVLVGERGQVFGLEVLSVADERTFLPWPSLELGAGEVVVPAPLAMLSEAELGYYRRSARSLRDQVELDAEAPDEPAVAAG